MRIIDEPLLSSLPP